MFLDLSDLMCDSPSSSKRGFSCQVRHSCHRGFGGGGYQPSLQALCTSQRVAKVELETQPGDGDRCPRTETLKTSNRVCSDPHGFPYF